MFFPLTFLQSATVCTHSAICWQTYRTICINLLVISRESRISYWKRGSQVMLKTVWQEFCELICCLLIELSCELLFVCFNFLLLLLHLWLFLTSQSSYLSVILIVVLEVPGTHYTAHFFLPNFFGHACLLLWAGLYPQIHFGHLSSGILSRCPYERSPFALMVSMITVKLSASYLLALYCIQFS